MLLCGNKNLTICYGLFPRFSVWFLVLLLLSEKAKVMVEVPFSLASKDGERPRIISGTIDLIFREKDGWVIADYKTDKVDGNLEALVAYHKPQVEMYRKFWEEISGEKVKEAGLYFTETAKWVTV